MIIAIIAGMGLLVFWNRYLFLEPRLPLKLSQGTRDFLAFSVPGMLTAICGPIIFMPGHTLDLGLTSPYVLGGISAIGLMLWTKRVLPSVVLSMAVFYLLRWMA
ncbi:Branched-chain amino acid transport protein (AzlD) [compost metagenome]